MAKKKSRQRPPVKRKTTTTPMPRRLLELLKLLRAADVDWGVARAKPGLARDWFGALSSDIDGPHPVHEEAHRILLASKRLQRQWDNARRLAQRFQEALPENLVKLWLEVDRLLLARATADCILHYNVGVEHGRNMIAVQGTLSSAGIDTMSLGPDTLLVLSYALADIARRLQLSGDAD